VTVEEEMKASAKERLLIAATNLLVKHGSQATTTRQIAEEADVNEVTLFRNFKTKENLLNEVICNLESNTLEFLDSILDLDQNVDVKTFLHLVGQKLTKFSREKSESWMIQYTEGLRDPDVAKTLSSIPHKVLAYLTEYFEGQMKKGTIRNIDPKSTAIVFMSYISYSNLAEQLFNNGFVVDRTSSFENFLDIITRGILAPDDSKY
jgi:AcrR family transcriptional regulator